MLTALLWGSGLAHADPVERDWVLLYWMAYDNNLEVFEAPITDMLAEGVTTPDIAVVVVADRRADDGLTRTVLLQDERVSEDFRDAEGSADVDVLAEQMAWVEANLPAERYAVVFLNHGGALGEMSLDEHPEPGGDNWLYVPEMAAVVSDFNARTGGAVELLFFQQCGKGAIENYYESRHAASVIMASQTVVGAPNHYYAPALQALGANPDVDGRELARLISVHETPEMFTTYTALSSDALDELPGRLDPVLEPLLAQNGLTFPVHTTVSFATGNEPFADLLETLELLYDQVGSDEVVAFGQWMQQELILEHRVSPRAPHARSWSGVSVLVPSDVAYLSARYPDYALYADSLLDELWGHVEWPAPELSMKRRRRRRRRRSASKTR